MRFYLNTIIIVFVFFIISCSDEKKMEVVIYERGIHIPTHHFAIDLNEKIVGSGLVDTIRFYGVPIPATKRETVVDTNKVEELGIDFNLFESQLNRSLDSLYQLEESDKIELLTYHILSTDQRIPYTALTKTHFQPGFMQPEIFIPEPKEFFYKGKRALKIEMIFKEEHKSDVKMLISKLLGPEREPSDFYTPPYIILK